MTRIKRILMAVPIWLTAALVLGTGCQLAYFLTPEKQKQVKAEYGKIKEQSVAVLVWSDRTTLDTDPAARRRVCEAVTYDMKKNLPKAYLVSPREVEKLQDRSGLDWESMSPAELCKRLKADILLRIDLMEYTTRAQDTRELRKGRVRGTVALYEATQDVAGEPVYQSEVDVTFPPPGKTSITDKDDSEIMREATIEFGQTVARKFYDHEVSMRGPADRHS